MALLSFAFRTLCFSFVSLAEGDTPEEVAQLQKMGNLVRSMMGQNGPEALAAALAEMDAMQAASASARQQ